MCAEERPDMKKVLNNLKQPIPIKRKVYLFLKNNLSKITKLKSCCGHPGEPGC